MIFGDDRHQDKQTAGGTPRLFLMPDGSYSWEQPDSNGTNGWEGFCGQTAIANLLTTIQGGVQVSPQDVSRAADDWTPGSRPSTLMRAIQVLAPDPSRFEVSDDHDLSSASPTAPIVCLLEWGGGDYHYVSVVGTRNGMVIFNHWGIQDQLPADEFDRRWGFRNGGFTSDLVAFFGGLSAYTSIRIR
ncbi:MAG: hypothetical protein KC501_23045 [Myxococcales bacterium]|nr:hypothetical protein [Myxococcales bacterium]